MPAPCLGWPLIPARAAFLRRNGHQHRRFSRLVHPVDRRRAGRREFLDAVWSWDDRPSFSPAKAHRSSFTPRPRPSGTPVPDVFVEARKRPVITLHASTLTPYYGTPITFTLKLTDPAKALITGGRTLKLFYSADKDHWEYVPKETATGVAVVRFAPDKPMYFKALYWGDGEWGMTESAVVRAVPKIVAATPKAPSIVDSDKRFKVRGRMSAGAKSAGRPVYLRLHRYSPSRGRWVYKGSLKADTRFRRALHPQRGSAHWRPLEDARLPQRCGQLEVRVPDGTLVGFRFFADAIRRGSRAKAAPRAASSRVASYPHYRQENSSRGLASAHPIPHRKHQASTMAPSRTPICYPARNLPISGCSPAVPAHRGA